VDCRRACEFKLYLLKHAALPAALDATQHFYAFCNLYLVSRGTIEAEGTALEI